MSLIVCGDIIQVYENKEHFKLEAEYHDNGPFKSVSWCRDSGYILCCSKTPFPVLKYNKKLIPCRNIAIETATIAKFMNTVNKYIVAGTNSGEIKIWDLKDNKISGLIKTGAEAIEQLSVNTDDTHVAVTKQNNPLITLCSIQTNQVVSCFPIVKSKEISSLKFSETRKGLLGVSTMENVVCVWDIYRSKPYFVKPNCHSNSCSEIAFSPINDVLLASVSYDRTLNVYDYKNNKDVAQIYTPAALKCIDISKDGVNVMVGTLNGSVFIYDLRNVSSNVQEIKAQKGVIQSVGYQPVLPQKYTKSKMETPDDIVTKSVSFAELSIIDFVSPVRTDGSYTPAATKNETLIQTDIDDTVKVDESPESVIEIDQSLLQLLGSSGESIHVKIEEDEETSPFIRRISSGCHKRKSDLLLRHTLEKSLQNLKTSTNINVASTPTDQEENYSNLSMSPITEDGDGKHINNQPYNLIIKEIKKEIEEVKKEIINFKKEIYEKCLDDLKTQIFNNYCDARMDTICLKFQIQNLKNDNDEKFQILQNNLQIIMEELRLIREKL